jgi:hypothetical protein
MHYAWLLGQVAAFASVAAASAGEIFRCKAPGGRITYQEIACDAASDGGAVAIPTTFPEVNLAERDRLLQREAALDERNLRRAELDTAERIARDNRLARQAEAQAERDRLAAAAASAGVGLYLAMVPARLATSEPPREMK